MTASLGAWAGPWAAYAIARTFGGAIEEHARVLMASEGTRAVGVQLLEFLDQAREAGAQQFQRHQAVRRDREVLPEGGSGEVPESRGGGRLEHLLGSGVGTREAGEMLGVSSRQVRYLIERGRLSVSPASSRGRCLVDEVSLAALLEQRSSDG